MRVEIARQSVCAADDQTGELEMFVEVTDKTSIGQLIQQVASAKFLQFSSSHTSILGSSGNASIARLYSPYHSDKEPEFFVPAHAPALEFIKNGRLQFKF